MPLLGNHRARAWCGFPLLGRGCLDPSVLSRGEDPRYSIVRHWHSPLVLWLTAGGRLEVACSPLSLSSLASCFQAGCSVMGLLAPPPISVSERWVARWWLDLGCFGLLGAACRPSHVLSSLPVVEQVARLPLGSLPSGGGLLACVLSGSISLAGKSLLRLPPWLPPDFSSHLSFHLFLLFSPPSLRSWPMGVVSFRPPPPNGRLHQLAFCA